MIGSSTPDRKAKRHCLQGAWLITRQLETLDVRREIGCVPPDDLRRISGTLGQQVAETFARANLLHKLQENRPVAKAQVFFRQEPSLRALHGECNRCPRGDRVESE